jgi:hypothetical protein
MTEMRTIVMIEPDTTAWRLVRLTLAMTILSVTAEAQQSCSVSGQAMPNKDLPEASGVAVSRKSPGVLWSHNDSGEPVLVAVGTDGATRGRTWVALAAVEDWEDIAVGPCASGSCVYVADVGDNNARRGSLTVYRIPEPALGTERSTRAESMRLTYPDGAKDAEAMVVLPDATVFVVTKGERSGVIVYRAGVFANGTTARLEPVATIVEGNQRDGVPRRERITGADASSDGKWIVLRTLSSVVFYRTADLTKGDVREVLRFDVSNIRELQGEGVAFGEGETIWLASEGGGSGRPGMFTKLSCKLPD